MTPNELYHFSSKKPLMFGVGSDDDDCLKLSSLHGLTTSAQFHPSQIRRNFPSPSGFLLKACCLLASFGDANTF